MPQPSHQDTRAPDSAFPSSSTLTETQVILGFHTLLKAALTQAKADGLLSDDDLAYLHPASTARPSANVSAIDVEVSGPALCLFFAALRARGDPPSIEFPPPQPDGQAPALHQGSPHTLVLSQETCPPSFLPFFQVWQQTVLPIQYLSAEHRYDLALMISEKEPVSSPVRIDVVAICNNLKRVAIDIAQRRSFQLHFSTDLQHALDSTVRSRPSSVDMGRTSSDHVTPQVQSQDLSHTRYQPSPSYNVDEYTHAEHNHATAATEDKRTHVDPNAHRPPQPPRPASSLTNAGSSRPASSAQATETLMLIRETLFSALGDCFALYPSLREIVARSMLDPAQGPQAAALKEWSSRACFACLCLSILEVALTRMQLEPPDPARSGTTPEGSIKTVQVSQSPPQLLRLATCPPQLVPLLQAFLAIGAGLFELKNLDDEMAIAAAQEADNAGDAMPQPQLDRLRHMLQTGESSARGMGNIPGDQKVGSQLTPVQAAAARADVLGLAINQMAMQIFRLPGFQERLSSAIGVLASIHSL